MSTGYKDEKRTSRTPDLMFLATVSIDPALPRETAEILKVFQRLFLCLRSVFVPFGPPSTPCPTPTNLSRPLKYPTANVSFSL